MLRRLWAPLSQRPNYFRSGATRLVGFGLSVFVLAAASLAAIPAMVTASGQATWGAIALGQLIGTVGGVAVGYGWGWFGPARIAGNSATGRRAEYLESILARGVLVLPLSAVAAAVAYLLAPTAPLFAAAGAVSTTSIGLTANWYFVGLARPFTMFAMETIPRTAGTVAGVILMYMGHSAIMGPLGSFFGMLAAFVVSTIWIIWETKQAGGKYRRLHPLWEILSLNRHGIASAIGSAAYVAAPLAIVSVIAPTIQPTFAMADRVKGLISVALAPVTTILQGWVPRGTESARVRRANMALVSASMLAILVGLSTMIYLQSLVGWLGSGQISVSWGVTILVSACISVTLFQSVLERAVLATFEQLRTAAKAIAAGSIVGLPLVGVGAHQLGTVGAFGGVLAGLLVCVAIELVGLFRFQSTLDP